jgi:hypothetical protein
MQLAGELNDAASWRRQKAEEYPDDEDRNLAAAEQLNELAHQCILVSVLGRYGNSEAFEKAVDQNPELWIEWNNQIGLIIPPRNLDELIECCLRFS